MVNNSLTLDSLERIIAAADVRQSAEAALAALKTLVAGDYYSAASFNTALDPSSFEMYLPQQGWLGTKHPYVRSLVQQMQHNPVSQHYFTHRQSTVLCRSQMVADQHWKHTAFYNNFHRPLGIEDLGAVFLNTTQGRVIGLTCGRSRNFTEREMRPVHSLQRVLNALPQFCVRSAPPPRPPASPLTSLSIREREILYWVRAGKRDAEIGVILGISPRTVHHHLEKIYYKLGVETRTAAAFVQ